MKKDTQKELDRYTPKIGKRYIIQKPTVGYAVLEKVVYRGFIRGLFTILDPDGRKTNVSVWKEMGKTKEIK